MTHLKENHDFDQAFPTFMIMALLFRRSFSRVDWSYLGARMLHGNSFMTMNRVFVEMECATNG